MPVTVIVVPRGPEVGDGEIAALAAGRCDALRVAVGCADDAVDVGAADDAVADVVGVGLRRFRCGVAVAVSKGSGDPAVGTGLDSLAPLDGPSAPPGASSAGR